MVNIDELETRLRKMSPKEVRDYALEHYPDLYFFRSGSKENNISKIIMHEDDLNLLDIIGKRARM